MTRDRPMYERARRRAPKGMTSIGKERIPVDSVKLAEDIVLHMENHPQAILTHVALDYENDRTTLRRLIEKHHPRGPELVREYQARENESIKRRKNPNALQALEKARNPDPLPPPQEPIADFPYILRYRSQPHGLHMTNGPLFPEMIDAEKRKIAEQRGWNFHYITLYRHVDS